MEEISKEQWKERKKGRNEGRILNYYRIIKTKNERKDGREKERKEGKEGRKTAKNERGDLGLRGRYFPMASALIIGPWFAPVI